MKQTLIFQDLDFQKSRCRIKGCITKAIYYEYHWLLHRKEMLIKKEPHKVHYFFLRTQRKVLFLGYFFLIFCSRQHLANPPTHLIADVILEWSLSWRSQLLCKIQLSLFERKFKEPESFLPKNTGFFRLKILHCFLYYYYL